LAKVTSDPPKFSAGCGTGEHGEIIQLVGLQYIKIKTDINNGFVKLFQGKPLLIKINENNV